MSRSGAFTITTGTANLGSNGNATGIGSAATPMLTDVTTLSAASTGAAQGIGEALPITHFLRMVRELMLKGAGAADIWDDLWPLAIILAALSGAALLRFRRTLD